MPLPPTALINGRYYSHKSYKFRLFGLLLDGGVKEANWKVTVERGKVRGNARESVGTTEGEVTYEASLTTFRPQWDALKERLRAVYGIAPMDVQGDLVWTYSERGMPTKTIAIRVQGINEADTSTSQGVDATEVKLTFEVAVIKEDGRTLVENSIY